MSEPVVVLNARWELAFAKCESDPIKRAEKIVRANDKLLNAISVNYGLTRRILK